MPYDIISELIFRAGFPLICRCETDYGNSLKKKIKCTVGTEGYKNQSKTILVTICKQCTDKMKTNK